MFFKVFQSLFAKPYKATKRTNKKKFHQKGIQKAPGFPEKKGFKIFGRYLTNLTIM